MKENDLVIRSLNLQWLFRHHPQLIDILQYA